MTVGFVADVRQEIGRTPSPDPHAEVAVLFRLGGRWHRRSTGTSLELVTRSGVVARRAFALLRAAGLPSPRIWVREPSGVASRSTYGVHLDDEATLHHLGVVDGAGRPAALLHEQAERDPAMALRAALLAVGSISTPGRPVHLEFAAPARTIANHLARIVVAHVGPANVTDDERHRVVVKSGTVVADVLELVGATDAHARWVEQQIRHQIRSEANRLANADTANVRRSVAAAQAQIEAVELVTGVRGWSSLDTDVRQVALARVANPAATLEELGELCDPPLSRSAVHRRLATLRAEARELAASLGPTDHP